MIAIPKQPGCAATLRLLRDMEAFTILTQLARLQLFRRYLQHSVQFASPILIDAADPALLATALQSVQPPPFWPSLPISCAPDCRSSWLRPGLRGTGRMSDRVFARRFRSLGAVLRPPSERGPAIGARILGSVLEVGLVTDGMVLASLNGMLRIDLQLSIPETLRLGLVGAPLCRVVGHELFEGRDYQIVRATTSADGTSTFHARTGLVPFTMPWQHLQLSE